jgi:hypothetical protein
VKLLLRWTGASVGRVVPAPVIGIALVVIAQWYWATPFGATKPVARLLLLVCGLVGLGAAVVILRRRSWRTVVGEAELRALAGIAAACFVGIGLVLVVSDAQLFTRSHFSIITAGNNDASSFGLIAQHLLDAGPGEPGNIAAYDQGARSLGFSGGACALLAGTASLTGLDVWQVQTSTMLVVLTLGAYTLALLMRQILGRERTVLAVGGAILGFAVVYSTYLVSQWFFAQLVGMAIVLAVASVMVRAVASTRRVDAVAAIGLGGLLMVAGLWVYPHMTVAGSAVLLPIAAITNRSGRALVQRCLRAGVLFGGAVLLAAALGPGLVVDAVEITQDLEDVNAGWPLPSLYPTEILGFQTSVYADQGPMTTVVSVLIGVVAAAAVAFAWRRGRGTEALQLALAMVLVVATYVVVYDREGGPTYRQWKWVTFFVPLFVACAVALFGLAMSLVRRFETSWRSAAYVVLGLYGAVALQFGSGTGFSMQAAPASYLSVTLDQINLQGDERLDELPSIHINATPYWETMWLAYFLRDLPLTLGQPTYYAPAAPVGPWYLERIDQPVPAGAEVTPLNETYRLTRMPD